MSPDGRVHLNAALLKVLRKGRALSQEALAELCFSMQLCVSIASIKRAEAGKSVLYRTARHLAQAFDMSPEQLRATPEAAPAGGGNCASAEPAALPAEQALRYVIELHAELHAPASEHAHDSLAQLAGQFGGQLASDGQWRLRVIFGMARACLGDAARAMRCAFEIARLRSLELYGGVALRLVRWDGARGRSCSAPPEAPGAAPRDIWVERALALQIRDAFVFAPPNAGSSYQRFIAVATPGDAPMVGRDAELRQFQGIVETLHEHRRGHVVYVRGMAGVGKTRLIDAFRALGQRAGLEVHHCALHAETGAQDQADMLAGLPDRIASAAMACPLLITVDDIHRGDSRLFSALGTLIVQSRDAPVVWVLGSRTEQDPAGTAFRPHLSELPLSVFEMAPLSEREAGLLARQFADAGEVHRQRCVERSRGNPLFLTQLLAGPMEQRLPIGLKHLVQIRMDALAIEHRRALCMAAVLGPGATLATLRGALQQPDYVPESAVRQGLVRPGAGDGSLFSHELVVECIYDAIDAAERHRLHRALAQVYRASDPALHAHHLRCADGMPRVPAPARQVNPAWELRQDASERASHYP
jgi:transcriptional regulator with XRE-family HTH domain